MDSNNLTKDVTSQLKLENNKSLGERYSFFPIKDEEMYRMYKQQEVSFWSSNEMDFSEDKKDYDMLPYDEKRLMDYVNAFFSATDGLILDNIVFRFLIQNDTLESKAFYIMQAAIELIHSETYSLIINTLIRDDDERSNLFNAANNLDCVKKKAEWIQDMLKKELSPSERFLVFACCEGIFFTSSFLFIFYWRHKGKFQNIIFANEQISKDEALHRDVGIMQYIRHGKLNDNDAYNIVKHAVELECNFVKEVLPDGVSGLSQENAIQYVQFLGDHLLLSCGHNKLWNINIESLPKWLNDIAMEQKSNFYEVKVGNYKMSNFSDSIDWRTRIKGKSQTIKNAIDNPSLIDF